jgi:hypothetical protein
VTEVYQTQGGLDKFLGIIGQIEKILGRLPPNSIGVGSCISWAKFISEGAGERWEKGPGLAADTNWLRSLMGDFLPARTLRRRQRRSPLARRNSGYPERGIEYCSQHRRLREWKDFDGQRDQDKWVLRKGIQ